LNPIRVRGAKKAFYDRALLFSSGAGGKKNKVFDSITILQQGTEPRVYSMIWLSEMQLLRDTSMCGATAGVFSHGQDPKRTPLVTIGGTLYRFNRGTGLWGKTTVPHRVSYFCVL
jgi:hypothetical protein